MASDYREEARDRIKEKSKGKYYKMPEGENVFRILPNALDKPKKFPKRPYFEYSIHRGVGPGAIKRTMTCGKDGVDGECWLCQTVEKMMKSSSGAKRKRAK